MDPDSLLASDENPRFDRSFEFDSLNDRFARFLLEEVFTAVESHKTPDGLPIKFSTNPDDRAIPGSSTGGIGAFTVAWQHLDDALFVSVKGKVYSKKLNVGGAPPWATPAKLPPWGAG